MKRCPLNWDDGSSLRSHRPSREDTSQVRLSHSPARTSAVFDDPNLVSHGGLVPGDGPRGARRPAGTARGARPARRRVRGERAAEGRLPGRGHGRRRRQHRRHGPAAARGDGRCSAGSAPRPRSARTCAPIPGETCCSWRRPAGSCWPGSRARRRCCPARTSWPSSTSTRRRSGSTAIRRRAPRFGHTKIQGKSVLVRGLNALIAAVSTPLAAPVAAATRLRGGNAPSSRGAAGLAAAGHRDRPGLRLHRDHRRADGLRLLRCRRDRRDPPQRRPVLRHRPGHRRVRAAIAAIPEDAWTAIEYPQAVWDDQLGCWVSDAEVAETAYAAFTSKKKELQVTARLIVRRVRDKKRRPHRAGRAVPRLALPRRLHRQPVRARPGRGAAPRPRRHRAAPRRPERRAAGAPAVGEVQRQRRLARHRRHRPQPAARRRHPGRAPPRQGPRGHRPPRPDRRRRPHRPPRPRAASPCTCPKAGTASSEWPNLFEAACGPPAAAA